MVTKGVESYRKVCNLGGEGMYGGINVILTNEQKKWLENLRAEMGVTFSEILQIIMDYAMENDDIIRDRIMTAYFGDSKKTKK